MPGMNIYCGHEKIEITIPYKFVIDTVRQFKHGSPGTYDPLDQREGVIIKMKPQEGA